MDYSNSSRPLVIYHANCADGFSAAWCFWRMYGNEADYFPGVYQQTPPNCAGRNVYLVDFSYKAPVVREILKVANLVYLIDHHKTALEDLQDIVDPRFKRYCDLERSGAMLAWNFLFTESPPPLLNHIQDRDLWQFKLPNTREIQANVFSYEYSFEIWDKLMSADQVELLKMTAAGAAIERKHHKDIAELVAVCRRMMLIGHYNVPVASMPYTLTSDAGHLMAKGYPFAACYWDTTEGRIFSLRSTEEGIDVSEVAKEFGGGGHMRAAGFKVPRDHPLARA